MHVTDCFQVPKDYHSRPEFRWVENEVGFAQACAIFFVLWRELTYLSEMQRLGFITTHQLERLMAKEFPTVTIAMLTAARMIVDCDGGYECRTFMLSNRHLSPESIGGAQKGAKIKSIIDQRKRFEKEAQGAPYDRTMFVRPNGTPMEEVEFRRTVMLIRLIDNQYGRTARTQHEFSLGLINDAYEASRKYLETEITGVCLWLNLNLSRNSPGTPTRTEEALREFDRLVREYGRTAMSTREKERFKKVRSIVQNAA